MKIILDVREHDLFDKISIMCGGGGSAALSSFCVPSILPEIARENLLLGDILFQKDGENVLLIERKRVSDLLASIKDGRYNEQSFRLINSSEMKPHNIIYLIEGIIHGEPTYNKKQIYGAITSLNYYKGFSVLKTSSLTETAELILYMAAKIEKDGVLNNIPILPSPLPPTLIDGGSTITEETIPENTIVPSSPQKYANVIKKSKKANITAENIGVIMLSQIPGVSSQVAENILTNFGGTLPKFIETLKENPDCLKDYKTPTSGRKISKNVIESIKLYLL